MNTCDDGKPRCERSTGFCNGLRIVGELLRSVRHKENRCAIRYSVERAITESSLFRNSITDYVKFCSIYRNNSMLYRNQIVKFCMYSVIYNNEVGKIGFKGLKSRGFDLNI